MSQRTRRTEIVDNFVTHRREMRESPAWRALPDEARRVLCQLELEHMRHAGAQNGQLVCPYADFVNEGGIRRASIALAIRQCAALGFLEVAHRGRLSAAMFRAPSAYRLTYVISRQGKPPTTDDWRKVKNDEDASQRLKEAALDKSEEHVRRENQRRSAPQSSSAAAVRRV